MKIALSWLTVAPFVLIFGSSGCVGAEAEHGLKVGEKGPEFKLKDQNGKELSLQEILKKGDVAVVFHRSADW